MLETKEQKRNFITIVALIVILVVVSFWHKNTPVNNQQNLEQARKAAYEKQQKEYQAYLNSIHIDPVASKDLYEKVLPKEEIQAEVENELQIHQPIILPVIDNSQLTITNRSDNKTTTAYFESVGSLLSTLQQVSSPTNKMIFSTDGDTFQVGRVSRQATAIIQDFAKIPVPKAALAFHKAQLASLQTYNDLLDTSIGYMKSPNENVWPQVYKDYAIINEEMKVVNQQFAMLDQEYAITKTLEKENSAVATGNFLIPAAHAFIPVVDIKSLAKIILEEALLTAFASFMVQFLNKLISKIQQAYQVGNFLYYTDAVVSGQYVDDYLSKYVGSSLDKAMIKNFIPQINCGNSQNYKAIYKQQADKYLGFDPASVSPSDPDFYSKMARTGDFLSNPNGWEIHYKAAAAEAQQQAFQAANEELVSEGNKVARDQAGQGKIVVGVATSLATYKAAFENYLNFGSQQAQSFAAKITSAAVQTLLNNFVFKGAVIKEQSTCIAVPQLSPVLPNSNTSIDTVTPPTTVDPSTGAAAGL